MSTTTSQTASDHNGLTGKTSPFIPTRQAFDPPSETYDISNVSLLKKLEEINGERAKRNQKREERRQKGEQVSDDEDDTISPLLEAHRAMHVASEGPALNAETLAISGERCADKNSGTILLDTLYTDEVVSKEEIQVYDDTIPLDIFVLAKCKISPPLSLFTVTSLERLRERRNLSYKKVGTPGEFQNVRILVTDDFPSDRDLKQTTWSLAYKTFLKWISSVAGPKVAQGWHQHYDTMVGDPDFEHYYKAYNDFDRETRSRFFAKPFLLDPTCQFWNTLLTNKKLVHGREDGNENRPSTRSSNRFNPYPSSTTSSGTSFRGSQSFQTICLRCGSRDGHRAYDCTASGITNRGRAWVCTAKNNRVLRVIDGKPICIRYNLQTCSTSTPTHALHVCSLCDDPNHGAARCTRV
jgi:hypothetical protein